MASNCKESFGATKLYTALSETIGKNEALIKRVMLTGTTGDNFSPEFLSFYKAKHPRKAEPVWESDKKAANKEIAKELLSYYYTKHPSVDMFIDNNTKTESNIYGYTSVFEREMGKSHIATFILDEFNNIQNTQKELPDDLYDYFKSRVKSDWLKYIFDIISSKEKIEVNQIADLYSNAEDKINFIKKYLNTDSARDLNAIAVYKELFGTDKHLTVYLDSVFANPKLQTIFHEVKKDLDEELQQIVAQEANTDIIDGSNGEAVNTSTDEDFDMSFITYSNHIGTYTSFMAHVGPRIKNYFNSLKKRNIPHYDPKNPTLGLDTNNTYGIAETMDANACCSMLYNQASFQNIPDMINKIQHIGETVSGFESFCQFAYDLRNNLDFATEVCTVFMKTKIAKQETVIEDDIAMVRTSNNDSNPQYVLQFDFLDDLKSTSIENNSDIMLNVKNDIIKRIKLINYNDLTNTNPNTVSKINDELADIINDVIKLVKTYLPSADATAIKSFIKLNQGNEPAKNNNHQAIQNINILLTSINNLINASENCKNEYDKMLAKAADITKHNRHLDDIRKKHTENRWVDPSEYKSTKEVYTDDYVNGAQSAIKNMVSLLLPYSVVNTSFNSRNIHGNNNSDIINNSTITKINKMLEDGNTDVLLNWGKQKLRSNQYKYSNILLEHSHKDAKGNIIIDNYGLFKYDSLGNLVITRYAKGLISLKLFNGASDLDNGNVASYTEMTEGDFLPTAYINFFKTVNKENNETNFASYFLKTPSDAPKTFQIVAPKYDTSNLFKIKDQNKFHNDVISIIKDKYPIFSLEEFSNFVKNPKTFVPSSIAKDTVSQYLKPNHNLLIDNNNSIKYIDDENKLAYVTYLTPEGYYLILQGNVVSAGNGKALSNAKFIGTVGVNAKTQKQFTENPDFINNTFYEEISTRLYKNDININDKVYTKPEIVVNTEDKAFNLLKNSFKQEMLNAATAIAHYFELAQNPNKPGSYKVDTDEITKQPKFKSDRSNNIGYKFYHLDKKGRVYYEKDGYYHLDGAVFHSNKFTLVLDEIDEKGKVKATPKNFLDEIITTNPTAGSNKINLLYNGDIEYILDENSKLVDIKFSAEQEQSINKALSDYLLNYNDYVEKEITEYAQFIKGVSTNPDAITNFAINNLITAFTYDDILDGDTKFYKDAQTVLKRAKQYQGSGVPYGISDYSSSYNMSLEDVNPLYSALNSKETQDWLHSLNLEVTQRKAFTAVTIKNSQTTNSQALNILVNKLVQEADVSIDRAMTLLYGPVDENNERRGGFTETKINDAQSYITYEEWIRRIAARGQLNRYKDLIERINDTSKPLSAEDITEFVQVQKNFYYDMYYDERYGIEVPRQIKNAEFVLVPRFIKGTDLEHVYNAMKKAGIDQLNTVETSKAANEYILTIWDNEGHTDMEAIKAFEAEAKQYSQLYSYNNLYTQQETPQHMNANNKAGVQVVKKLFDNIPPESSLYHFKEEFFRLFSTNIADSYSKVMKEFNIPVDANGNIKLNENGIIENLDKKAFLNKLKEEMMRTGIDSNMLDYVTINPETNMPYMPSFNNAILTKFESIVQSLFNSNITRQTLPGFHAAQITNVGLSNMSSEEHKYVKISDNNIIIDKETYNALPAKDKKLYRDDRATYDKKLRYHPDGKGYIEVKVPYSFLGIDKNSPHYSKMSDEDILSELAKEDTLGLDMIIGYRIPTEGKQSVCNMKVVGFLPDGTGSTIAVPNDWVSQTGSDFDIDSVYAIQFETYKDKTGRVRKIKYKTNVENNWLNYLKQNLDDSTIGFTLLSNRYSSLYNKLPKDYQDKIKALDNEIYNYIHDKKLSGKEAYQFRLTQQQKGITFIGKTIADKELAKTLFDMRAAAANIENYINNFESDLSIVFNKEDTQALTDLNNMAKANNLKTFDEFKELKPWHLNSRKARNTRILEIMQTILLDKEALEENLSRSNFDGIVDARNKNMNKNTSIHRNNRSPYNIIDQIKYQEEAMSGATLKAFSVTLDTFCSICNTVRPTLTKPIYVVYDKTDDLDTKEIKSRFSKVKVTDDKIKIRHNQYGWNNDNRTIEGSILTSYSSQTTALILDAIKEGNIPNVNQYTFSAFKTLANLGLNYDATVSFIMQPAITEIVKTYNSTKSIYSDSNDNSIATVIANIAKRLNIEVSPNENTINILQKINKEYKDKFNKIFKQEEDDDITIGLKEEDTVDLPILVNKCKQRLNDSGFSSPVEEALFDLGVVLTFNKLYKTANEIGDIARCCNPDKFGAKQTVFATRKVFQSINECCYKTEDVYNDAMFNGNNKDKSSNITFSTGVLKTKRKPILTVDDEHILNAIYPGILSDTNTVDDMIKSIANITEDDIQKSKYPTLFAFLKYSTSTSLIMAKTIFETQTPAFLDILNNIKSVFSGYNTELDEDTYNKFQRYVLSSIYKECPAIKFPVNIVNKDGVLTKVIDNEVPENSNESSYLNDKALTELKRIYGYEREPNLTVRVLVERVDDNGNKILKADGTPSYGSRFVSFNVVDITNPTNEELAQFNQLSPAQKIQWIKSTFTDAGLFNLIKVTLFNPKARGKKIGMQTLEFIDENLNSNIVYNEFKKVFYSKNPLLVSAAIDIVKYGVLIEGLNMSSKAVNKVIDNSALINTLDEGGLGFVDFIREQMNDINGNKSIFGTNEAIQALYENYLRSHPDLNKIKTITLSKRNKAKYNFSDKKPYGAYVIKPKNSTEDADKNKTEFNELLCKCGIKSKQDISKQYKTNNYIRIKEYIKGELTNTLYRIKEGDNFIYLYPLSNLEANENAEWSCNEDNNHNRLSKDGHEAIFNAYNKIATDADITHEFVTNIVHGKDYWYEDRRDFTYTKKALKFNLNNLAKDPENGLTGVYETIKQSYEKLANGDLLLNSRILNDYIFEKGIPYGSQQKILLPNGVVKHVVIYKPKEFSKIYKPYYNKEKDVNDIKDDYTRGIISSLLNANIIPSGTNNIFAVRELAEDEIEDEDFNDTTEEDDELGFMAKTEDILSDEVSFMLNQSHNPFNDENIEIGAVQNLLRHNITENKESIKNNKNYTAQQIAGCAARKAAYIKRHYFDQFVEDPNNINTFYSITDPEVIPMIKSNPKLANKFIEAINQATAFIRVHNSWLQGTTEESEEFKYYVNEIAKAVDIVNKLPINDAIDIYNHTIADKLSTNPLIKQGLIDVMDGFYRSYGIMYKFHDIAENGNPIVQIMLKDVLTNLNAREKNAVLEARKFKQKFDDIIKRAEQNGMHVDMNHVIHNNKVVRPFSDEFNDKLTELREAKQEAERKYGLGSIEQLEAKWEYDYFVYSHCNKEVVKDYYAKRLALEAEVLWGGTDKHEEIRRILNERHAAIPELYSEYMKIYYRRLDCYNYIGLNGLDDEHKKELERLNAEEYELMHKSFYIKDGKLVQINGDLDTLLADDNAPQIISTETLHWFKDSMAYINKEYFDYEESFGFYEQLKTNLNIVRSLENLDENGIPQTPRNILESNPKYLEAKLWIQANARFIVDFEDETTVDHATGKVTVIESLGTKIKNAMKLLGRKSNLTKEADYVLNKYKDKGIKDEFGVVDARLISEDDIQLIKLAQREKYKTADMSEFTDRVLISNASPETDIYNQAFYAGMSSVKKSEVYYEVVTKINNILKKYYHEAEGIVDLTEIPDTKEGIDELKQLSYYYKQLRDIRAAGPKASEEAKAFIEENVEFAINDSAVERIKLALGTKKADGTTMLFHSQEYTQALIDCCTEPDAEGNPNGAFNRFLFSYAKPKFEKGTPEYERFVDKGRTEAIALLNHVYRKVPTKYFWLAKNEAFSKGKLYYSQWLDQNTVYNPYTRKKEPLDCWMTSEIKDEIFENDEVSGHWEPTANQRSRKPRDGKTVVKRNGENKVIIDKTKDKRNKDYKEHATLQDNYIPGSDSGKYDNKIPQNKYEKELSDLIYNTLMATATVDKTESFFKQSNLPRKATNGALTPKQFAKEMLKTVGLDMKTRDGYKPYQKEIGYEYDFNPDMPMTGLLRNSHSIDYEKRKREAEKELANIDKVPFNTPEEKENKIKELKEVIKENKDKLQEINDSLMSKDWKNVIGEYLIQAGHYNAVLDNKNKLYYLLNVMRNHKSYSRKYGASGDLKINSRKGNKENPVYEESVDPAIIEQLETFIHRVMFDEWKETEGSITNIFNFLQNLTSASYMMFNVKGGFANWTLGETGKFAEAAAGEFVETSDWRFGISEYAKGIISYGRHAFKVMTDGDDICYSKQDAIIQAFNVVEYDQITGEVIDSNPTSYFKKFRDFTFSPQTSTEHFMQNSMLFSILHSHKIFAVENGEYTYMTKQDYLNYRSQELLSDILTPEQLEEFANFKKDIQSDKNKLKDYAWFRKDIITDFIYLHCNKEIIDKYIKTKKEKEKEYLKDWDAEQNIYDQLELGKDGHLAYVPNSKLSLISMERSTNDENLDKAVELIGRLSEKVRKVNNKIHGVYNRLGSADLEKTFYGSLIMQYHKHLPMGLLKRYMRRGHWNEFRNAVDKGMVESVKDLLALNYEKIKVDAGMSEEQLGALQSFTFMLTHALSYLRQIKTTYDIMPAYDRANIRRNVGDALGVIAACTGVALLWYIADDDNDMQDSIWFNFALYETDRLASESFLYNPIGLYTEGKKLLSQPVAAQSIIGDALNLGGSLIDFMFDDEYEYYYDSGRFAGRLKMGVYVERRLPMWHGISSILDLPDNNHYYKLGQNPIGMFNIKDLTTNH